MSLPHFLRDMLIEMFGKKMCFVFSNVPGPSEPYKLTGVPTKSLAFFVPAIKSLAGGIAIISHCDTVKISLTMDKVTMGHPK